jgi:hypothetical protein
MFDQQKRNLRLVLIADAASGAGSALLLFFAPDWLSRLTGVPTTAMPLLIAALLGFALLILATVHLWSLSRPAVLVIIAINEIWVVASLAAAAGAIWPLTEAGVAFVLLQAVAVAAFALAEWRLLPPRQAVA